MKEGIKYFLTGMMLGLPIAGMVLNGCDKKDNSGLEGKIGQGVVERRLAEEGRDYGNGLKNNPKKGIENVAERYIEERARVDVGWNEITKINYTNNDLKDMTNILYAEAANQTSKARKGVARVILNRV